MITTSKQLKDKIANISGGDSKMAQILLRKYVMERFLARLALSKYKNHFILKGGMLVSAIVGEDARSTMDIDTTVRSLSLNKSTIEATVKEIMEIDLEDRLQFEFSSIEEIMEEHDYTGIRITLKVYLEKLRETIRIDLSAGDAITPEAVCLSYPMMFDQGSIELRSYNIETLLAEKIETILSRSTANTRMRDFYDIHILWNDASNEVDIETLRDAIRATASKRGTDYVIEDGEMILEEIAMSPAMKYQWDNYQRTNKYVGDLAWDEVIGSVSNILLDEINLDQTDDFEMTMF